MKYNEVKYYSKVGTTPMYPWSPDTDMTDVSVSDEDKANESPKAGDMIAFDHENVGDRWRVSQQYFEEHYTL